jgi:hypothetical protein
MVAMATAEYAALTGDAISRTKTHDIVSQLAPYQNDDGSFPHWCFGSKDIHYTGWMAMELMHIRRLQERAACDDHLQRMSRFLERWTGGKVRIEQWLASRRRNALRDGK